MPKYGEANAKPDLFSWVNDYIRIDSTGSSKQNSSYQCKIQTTNVQYETVRHDMAYPHLLYFVVGPSVVGAALNLNSTR